MAISRPNKILIASIVVILVTSSGWATGRAIRDKLDVATAPEAAAPLAVGDTIPSLALRSTDGGAVALHTLVAPNGDHVLLVLASACSNCIGELASWNEWIRGGHGRRLTALVYAPDSTWLSRTMALVEPVFPVLLIQPEQMELLSARLTPVAYLVDSIGRVKAAALGIAETARLRTAIDKSQSDHSMLTSRRAMKPAR